MKPKTALLAAIAAIGFATQATAAPLTLAEQGSFAIGGTVKTSPGSYTPIPESIAKRSGGAFWDAHKAAVQAVKKAGAPQVFLYANTQDNAHLRTGGGLSYRERENTIGLGIRWQLFEGYKRHYQEKALLAQQEQEEAALAALQSRLSLEMRQAYRQLTTAVEKQAIAEKSAASAQFNYQTRLGRYRAGVGSLNELLQAQRSLNTMRIALADATRERHQAALQLLFSVGKAFPAE